MSLKCGIVGLPNVGKSTLFNAITNTTKAQMANYPFCTIEPNIGLVEVPDARLDKLAQMANAKKITHNQLEIVDIAGLVAGANKGEGLGNKFLANIRECDVIINVIRCFDDKNIVHVNNTINPVEDLKTIETELLLADVGVLEKIVANSEKKAKSRKEEDILQFQIAKKLLEHVSRGEKAYECEKEVDEKEQKISKQFCLLTSKKSLYVANVDENSLKGNAYTKQLNDFLAQRGEETDIINICAMMEAEISTYSPEEKKDFLALLNCQESGLDKIIKASYNALGLITFFTVGEKETRAWSLKKDSLAPEAAGVIHTDFQKGFIKAETISYEDYIAYPNEEAIKEAGKVRTEGKEYVVRDGDIFNFKFNV